MATENDNNEYIQKMFEAMDIIMAKHVQELTFDKTIKCSITDASNSDKGEYTVTDGCSTFKVYSDSIKYSNGASVYVNIPNGDYNNRKLITGLYDRDRSDYNTDDPETDYIDITQNLITDFEGEAQLTANGETTQVTLWDSGPHFGYQIEKKDDKENDEDSAFKAYKKMFIKAKFQSWLSRRNILLGNYGIRVDILGKKENTTSQTSENWYMYKLDSSNMIGDPYDFEVGFEQKIVFNIDPEMTIDRVRVVFYQDGNFYDKSKKMITPSEIADLYVSEPFVSFGYSFEDFDEDTVLLYTFDSDKYAEYLTEEKKKILSKIAQTNISISDFDDTAFYAEQLAKMNQKKIILRWIHETTSEDDTSKSFASIANTEDVPETAIVHWYKYNLAEDISDELAGAFWEELPEQKNKFELITSPDSSKAFEWFKVVVENCSKQYVQDFLIANDNEIIEIENIKEEDRTEEQTATLENLKNSHLESFHTYESNILEFENENMVPDADTIDLIKGLSITCDDAEGGYNGVYRIYNDNGEIMSTSESTKKRLLTANYTSLVTGVEKLDAAEKIMWYIPLENTMIYPPTEGQEYTFYDKIGTVTEEEFKDKTEKYYIYLETSEEYKEMTEWNAETEYYRHNRTEISMDQGYLIISRYGIKPTSEPGSEEADSTQQYFRIKNYYTQSAINNTVYCNIIKNNRTYSASFDMVFGPCGTNGTNFTFTLEFDDKQPAITCTDDSVIIIPRIYDYQNKDVTNEYIKKIQYSWYSSNTAYYSENKKHAIEIGSKDSSTGAVTLLLNSHEMDDLNYFILRGKVADITTVNDLKNQQVDGEVDTEETENDAPGQDTKISLFAYLPIPIRRTADYVSFDGANKIVYDSSGVNPQYYKDPYTLYTYENKKTSPVIETQWMMSFGKDTRGTLTDTTDMKYYPTLDANYKLIPTAMYMQENGTQVSVFGYTTGNNGFQIEWIQPLYIYQNSFSSSLLNSWDGSLTFDKENGTILSTMMGAGKKDSQNRFNGVLMGDLTPAFNSDETVSALAQYYNGTGLYGFHEGQKSFGLNINGKAFFGKSGRGQILIDGNSGTIQSQHFLASMKNFYNNSEDEPNDVKKAGMKIDLDNGILETYGINSTAMVKIDPTAGGHDGEEGTDPYLVVRSGSGYPDGYSNAADVYISNLDSRKSGVNLLYAGAKQYYLQSYNFYEDSQGFSVDEIDSETNETYSAHYTGKGTKLDLMNGTLKGYDFSLKGVNGKTGDYFTLNSEGSSTKPFLEIQASATDADGDLMTNKVLEFTKNKQAIRSIIFSTQKEQGTEINLTDGKITSYGFHLKAVKDSIGIQISSDGKPFLCISDKSTLLGNKAVKLINITKDEFIIQSKDFNSGSDGIEAQGMRFDFKNNKIDAYSFTLKAYKKGSGVNTTQYILMDSTQTNYPFQIGSNFKVSWQGNTTVNNIIATGGQIGGWYISYGKSGIENGIYSFNPEGNGSKNGIALLAKGELKIGAIFSNSVAGYKIYNTETQKWELKTTKPSNFDTLKNQGLAYIVYSEVNDNKIGFFADSNEIIVNGAILNKMISQDATINQATLNNCLMNSATMNRFSASNGTISSCTINSCTITNCSVSSLKIGDDELALHTQTFATRLSSPYQKIGPRSADVTCSKGNRSGSYTYYKYTFDGISLKETAYSGTVTISDVVTDVDVKYSYYRPNKVKTKTIAFFGSSKNEDGEVEINVGD